MSYHYRMNEPATGEEVKDIVKFFYNMEIQRIDCEISETRKLIEKKNKTTATLIAISTAVIILAMALLKVI